MIFRAAFFIGLVYVLTPHEPDLGLGRPSLGQSGLGAWLPSPATVLSVVLPHRGQDCGTCAAGPGLKPHRGLTDIKAEIGAAVQARRDARS